MLPFFPLDSSCFRPLAIGLPHHTTDSLCTRGTTVTYSPHIRHSVKSKAGSRLFGCRWTRNWARLSYHADSSFHEGPGRSSQSHSPPTWASHGRPAECRRGGWAYCADAPQNPLTEGAHSS